MHMVQKCCVPKLHHTPGGPVAWRRQSPRNICPCPDLSLIQASAREHRGFTTAKGTSSGARKRRGCSGISHLRLQKIPRLPPFLNSTELLIPPIPRWQMIASETWFVETGFSRKIGTSFQKRCPNLPQARKTSTGHVGNTTLISICFGDSSSSCCFAFAGLAPCNRQVARPSTR